MRFIAWTIHCHLLRSGTVARSPFAPSQAQYWGRACCGGNGPWWSFSRHRECVTGRRFAPNSFVEAHETRFTMTRSRTMLTKHFLTISLLLPLVAISATAHAGSTITDKSYWPNEARPSAYNAGRSQSDLASAFAFDRRKPRSQIAPKVSSQAAATVQSGGYVWRYQGGPKSPMIRTRGK